MTKTEMLTAYERISAAHDYIVGFTFNHDLYMARTAGIPEELMSYEPASRGQGYGLRLRVRKAHKLALLPTAIKVGAEADLDDAKYNRGEVFEKLVTEYFGQVWVKDHIPFTVQGDINVDGVEIQIKLDGATFTNEKFWLGSLPEPVFSPGRKFFQKSIDNPTKI